MKSRCSAALAVVLTAALAGCGTHPAPKQTLSPHCAPNDYAMQCALTAPPASSSLLQLAAPVARGVDFGWGGPTASTMHANGWMFGASYLSTDPAKNWHVSLANSYAANHIARVFVWETSATRALGGCGAGGSDARAARSQGAPFHARAIYFAVDFELSQTWTVESYFRCAARVLGIAHMGAYGGYATIKVLFDSHLIHYGWQTYAWSGGRLDGRAQLYQYLNGSAFDYDRALSRDYGQTPYVAPKPKPDPRLKGRLKRRTKLRRILLAQGCRVEHPSDHCKGVLHTGGLVNLEIGRLGGH